jgi:SecD/SecF fusion protein
VEAKPNQNTTTNGPSYYVVDDRQRQVLAGPAETRDDVVSILDDGRLGAGDRVVEIKEGTTILQAESPTEPSGEEENEGAGPDCWFVINDNFALQGEDIRNPEQQFDQGPGGSGAPNVTFEFSEEGRRIWQEVTRSIAERGLETTRNQHFAIVLDNELISTPFIDFRQNPDGIDGANGSQISGGFTIQSAQRLANLLKTGALPIDLELISQSQVSATLGQEALDQGIIAAAVGFAIVAAFLLFFYRVLGLIAVLALAVYAVYFFALIRTIPIVLTLPGIAGLVLTIGVTADANIVIFERVKEEIRNGRSVQAGIAQGYKKGITAIIDANVVTFMTAFILFILATAGVKGFAFVLGIGTLVTVFTAVLMTQAVLGSMGRSRLISIPACSERPRRSASSTSTSSATRSTSSPRRRDPAHRGAGHRRQGPGVRDRLRVGHRDPRGPGAAGHGGPAAHRARAREPRGRRDPADHGRPRARRERLPDLHGAAPAEEVARVTGAIDQAYGIRGSPDTQSIGPTFGDTVARSALIAVIASLLVIGDLHRAALRVEVRRAGAHRDHARHPDHGGRVLPHRPGGDHVDRRGAAHHPRLLALRHDHRLRPHPGERPADAARRLLADRQPVHARGHRALAGHDVLHGAADLLPAAVRRRDAQGLRVRAARRPHLRHVLVDLHRRARADAVEGARAGLPAAHRAHPRAVRRPGAGVRHRGARRDRGRRGRGARAPKKATRSLFTPDDPRQGVSRTEFDEMVRDLPIDEPAPAPAPAAGSVRADDLSPEDLVMKDDKPKRDKSARGPRNKRHGRPR